MSVAKEQELSDRDQRDTTIGCVPTANEAVDFVDLQWHLPRIEEGSVCCSETLKKLCSDLLTMCKEDYAWRK